MDSVFIDFETQSDLPISYGTSRYIRTRNSGIICMSYAINDGPVRIWLPGMPSPYDWLKNSCEVYAYNAQFDQRVNNVLGFKHRLPFLPLDKCIDVMALCGRYTLPQSLDKAAKVMDLKHQKLSSGSRLMKKITQPPFKYTRAELREFYRYGMRDTECMVEMVMKLPARHLSPREQEIWESTVKINRAGLPIAYADVKRIYAVVQYYVEKEGKKVAKITDGKVGTVKQVQKMLEWVAENSCVTLRSLQATDVQKALEDDQLEPNVRELLELRQILGQSSIAKYKRLLEQTHGGRIYDNLRYCAAATGRYGGLGFQVHNLPRATVDDVEGTVQKFHDTTILKEDPMFAAKALIRSVIQAPEGKALVVADYKSIENRIIAWVAGEDRIVELFNLGLDEYKDFARDLFNVEYSDVTYDQRFFGKTTILGAGYGLGAKGFLAYAKGFGLDTTLEEATKAINLYRKTHRKITAMWYELKDAAVNAIRYPNDSFKVRSCTFGLATDKAGTKWLCLNLPSNRNLYYCDPEIKDDVYGDIPTHMGINSYNKKWQRLKIIPGRFMENVVQALARDVLAEAVIALQKKDKKVIAHIHDEVIVEVDKDKAEESLEDILRIMCIRPSWGAEIPLDAEGEITRRYKKI